MKSPIEQYTLQRLEGDADQIQEHGRILGELAETMDLTALRMQELGDSSIYRSQATDKLANTAGEIDEDLRDAAVRYSMTGATIKTYGEKLATAQEWINANVENVRQAEEDYQDAIDALDDAEDAQRSLNRVMPWEDDPTQAQVSDAADAVTTARGDLAEKTTTRNELWTAYETHFGDWDKAYTDAVGGIENAMDTADNNDGFWEAFDNFLDVLGVIVLVLSVVALIIGAPLTGLLAGIIIALSVVILLGELLQFACGKATLADVGWAAVSLLPLGAGRLLSRGGPALSTVMRGARGNVVSSIRGGLPAMRWNTPFKNVSTAWQWLRAPANARGALPRPGAFVNPFRGIPMGNAEAVQVQRFIATMRNSPYAPQLANLANAADSALPGVWKQVMNTGVFGISTGLSVGSLTGTLPSFFNAENVTVGNGPVR